MFFSGNQAELLKNKLIEDINNSNLPISLGYYVVKDVFTTFHLEYLDYLKKELEEGQSENIEEKQFLDVDNLINNQETKEEE